MVALRKLPLVAHPTTRRRALPAREGAT